MFSGEKPGTKCRNKKKDFEIYDGSSYLTITGQTLNGSEISSDADKIRTVYDMIFPPPVKSVNPPVKHTSQKSTGGEKLFKDMSDSEKLQWGLDKYSDLNPLWSGNTASYDSPSEADYALINKLIILFGRDESKVSDFFKQSGLWTEDRAKKKAKNYVEQSVSKSVGEFSGQTTEEYFEHRPSPPEAKPEIKIPENFEVELLAKVSDNPGVAFTPENLGILQEIGKDKPRVQKFIFDLKKVKNFPIADLKKELPPPKEKKKSQDAWCPYKVEGNNMTFEKNEDVIQLCTGVLQIISKEIRDDGETSEIFFNIGGKDSRGNALPPEPVKRSDFGKANWLFSWPERIIPAAGYGLRDHTRAAVQHLSKDFPELRTYTHTGVERD